MYIAIASRNSRLLDMQEYDPLAGLPEGCELVTFTNFKKLAQAANYIFSQLDTHEDEGNQFLVVVGLSSQARDRLMNRKCNLGVSFRFMWDGSMGIIKVLPSRTHDMTTSELRAEIAEKIANMGIPRLQTAWASTTTHEGTVTTKGKEADESFHPPPRFPVLGQQSEPWPTLVIETGVSESLAKLREDVKWWFNNSNGEVRIVLILSIKKRTRTVLLERWQLAPPVPRGRMITRQQNLQPMSLLTSQPAAQQMPCSLQKITITPTSASGSLILPFEALFCRAPLGDEADIILNPLDLINCIRFVF